jgi:sugar lactone lactonase YvrE
LTGRCKESTVDFRRIERIISNAGTPNGVLVSPNRETLYVSDQGIEDE